MDSYQPIYDAVRSRISHCDLSGIVEQAAMNGFDFGHARMMMQEQIATVGFEMARPSTIHRPTLSIDGNMWCALYGANLQDGVAGFGASPEEAMRDFDKAWQTDLAARRA